MQERAGIRQRDSLGSSRVIRIAQATEERAEPVRILQGPRAHDTGLCVRGELGFGLGATVNVDDPVAVVEVGLDVRDVEKRGGLLGQQDVVVHVAGDVEDGARGVGVVVGVVGVVAVLADLFCVGDAEEVLIVLAEGGVDGAGAVELGLEEGGNPGVGLREGGRGMYRGGGGQVRCCWGGGRAAGGVQGDWGGEC